LDDCTEPPTAVTLALPWLVACGPMAAVSKLPPRWIRSVVGWDALLR